MQTKPMSDQLQGTDKLSIGAGIVCSIIAWIIKIHIPKDFVQRVVEAFIIGAAGGSGTWVATKILKIAWTAFVTWLQGLRKNKKSSNG
jgi:hypothetical protein